MRYLVVLSILSSLGCGQISRSPPPPLSFASVDIQNAGDPPIVPPSSASVVIVGDSIIAQWPGLPAYIVNAGVGGQTTAQILARFDADVVARHPATVVIEGGVNDVAITGSVDSSNVIAMIGKAQAAGIRVVLLEVLWPNNETDVSPTAVLEYNAQLLVIARAYGVEIIDTYGPFVGRPELFRPNNNVHPIAAGYDLLWALLSPVIP